MQRLMPKFALYDIISFSTFAFAFSVILVAVLAFFKRRDLMALRFLTFSFIVMFWGVFFALGIRQLTYGYTTLLIFWRLCHAAAVFIPSTWVHFILAFLSRKEPFRNFLFIQYALSFLLLLISPTDLLVPELHSVGEHILFPGASLGYHIFAINFFIVVAYGFFILVSHFFRSQGDSREQTKYLLIGSGIGFFCGGVSFLLVYGIPFPLIVFITMPLYPFFVGFALIRHGLFNVDEIVKAAQKEKLAALGVLSASINHEIKSPLYVVKELIQMNLKELETPGSKAEELVAKGKDHLGRAARQIDRIYDTIKRLSNFAKQGVQNQPQMQPVSVREVLDTVEDLVRYDFSIHNIKLIREIEKDAEEVLSDARYLEEILFNLIVNAGQALSASREGGEIIVKACREDSKYVLSVADNGPSIPKEKLDQIFEPFYTTKKEGSGLGLYITKQLVERLNGKIEVQSNSTGGTSFTFKF